MTRKEKSMMKEKIEKMQKGMQKLFNSHAKSFSDDERNFMVFSLGWMKLIEKQFS